MGMRYPEKTEMARKQHCIVFNFLRLMLHYYIVTLFICEICKFCQEYSIQKKNCIE